MAPIGQCHPLANAIHWLMPHPYATPPQRHRTARERGWPWDVMGRSWLWLVACGHSYCMPPAAVAKPWLMDRVP